MQVPYEEYMEAKQNFEVFENYSWYRVDVQETNRRCIEIYIDSN